MAPGSARRRASLDIGIFRSLGDPERAQLERHASLREKQAKEYLYFDATRAEQIFVVASGRVRTCRSQSSGGVTTLEEFAAGEVFGLAAMLRAATYGETAQLLTDGSVWSISAAAFLSLMAKQPALSGELLALVAARLQRAHDRLCGFARASAAARLAQAVLERDTGGRIQITRQTLCEAAGTTVETAIRMLRRFECAGWIASGTGWIETRDRAALRRIADGEPLRR